MIKKKIRISFAWQNVWSSWLHFDAPIAESEEGDLVGTSTGKCVKTLCAAALSTNSFIFFSLENHSKVLLLSIDRLPNSLYGRPIGARLSIRIPPIHKDVISIVGFGTVELGLMLRC